MSENEPVNPFDEKTLVGLAGAINKTKDNLNASRERFYDSDDETRARLKTIEDLVLNLTDLMEFMIRNIGSLAKVISDDHKILGQAVYGSNRNIDG